MRVYRRRPLRSGPTDYFRQITLDKELGTIVWPNGADIAPETLHAWVARGLKPIPV